MTRTAARKQQTEKKRMVAAAGAYEVNRERSIVSEAGAPIRVVKISLTDQERESLSVNRRLSDINVETEKK